jgi:hypothetical protein
MDDNDLPIDRLVCIDPIRWCNHLVLLILLGTRETTNKVDGILVGVIIEELRRMISGNFHQITL